MRPCAESGFVFFALIALILPLVVLVGSITTTMQGRSSGLLKEIHQEKALMAAESGLDEALFLASQGTLISGSSFTRNLGDGLAFQVTPILLKTDGIDNDGDTLVDEADEDVFQLTIDGTYGRARRRLAAYLGPLPGLPVPEAAATLASAPTDDLQVTDGSLVTGLDTNMDGTPGPGPHIPGMSIMAPGTTADLSSILNTSGGGSVTGSTASPSLGVASAIDLAELVEQLKNSANITLASDEYDNESFGNGAAGTANIVFREGDVEFENVQGAGILVVTGELELEGSSRWDGIIIAMGDELEIEEGSELYGAVFLGPGVEDFEVEADGSPSSLHYSSEAIALAQTLAPAGKYVAFNGWQEISIY